LPAAGFPAGFQRRVLDAIELYTPLTLPDSALTRGDHSTGVYARLRPGGPVTRAQSEMDAISSALARWRESPQNPLSAPLPKASIIVLRGRLVGQAIMPAAGFQPAPGALTQ